MTLWTYQLGRVSRYLDDLRMARSIDPDAFKPLMVPHYTGEQLVRQQDALRKARERTGEGEGE